MKTNPIILLVFSSFLFFSCNKDDDSVALSDRAKTLLGQWEYQAIVSDRAVDLNGDNISSLDLFNTQELPQCGKDNIATYTENGPSGKAEYNVTENNLACNNNDPFSLVEEDFWTLTDNNSMIKFENREPFRIVNLTKNQLMVESDDVFQDLQYTITITYKRK